MEALQKGAIALSLEGAFDVSSQLALKRQLSVAERADAAIIDISQVTYAGTTLFNALIALRKAMRRHGGTGAIRLTGTNAHMRKLLAVTCLDRLFEVA
jgi:anti-anti-sigma factor